ERHRTEVENLRASDQIDIQVGRRQVRGSGGKNGEVRIALIRERDKGQRCGTFGIVEHVARIDALLFQQTPQALAEFVTAQLANEGRLLAESLHADGKVGGRATGLRFKARRVVQRHVPLCGYHV